jgi:tRNA threonylcarbamoyladenosine biosynthesis protein TsaB
MAAILSIETSTSVCSVALHRDGKLVASLEVHLEYSHSSKLAVLVQQVMRLGEIGMSQLSAIALSAGPGSYTGLRIGTSLAKGLCYALDVPLIAVPTLQVMATTVGRTNIEDAFFCPMIDARRMEVYCQIYDANLVDLVPIEAKVITPESFEAYLNAKPVIFFGNGAAKCKEVIVHKNARFLADINPLAAELGELARLKFESGKVEDLFTFVPMYLKEFFLRKAVEA